MKFEDIDFAKELKKYTKMREAGDPFRASVYFSLLEGINIITSKWQYVADAMLERIVCYQHIYEMQGDQDFLMFMLETAEQGLRICTKNRISQNRAKHFLYRIGVAHYKAGHFVEAEDYFKQALIGVTEKSSEYPEFVGYLGLTLLKQGYDSGYNLLNRAINLIEKDKKREQVERRIILAGLHMKMATGAHAMGNKKLVRASMETAKEICVLLATKDRKVVRLKQFQILQKELRVRGK